LSLTIPLALAGSFFIPSSTPEAITPLSSAGAVLVVLAFGMLGIQGWRENTEEADVSGLDSTERDGGIGA
jgi:hypothetical protein